MCFSTAHVACECSLAANDADIAYGWRMVKLVVVSLSGGQESRSGSHLAITDQHDPQVVREVCRNFNSRRCFLLEVFEVSRLFVM